MKLTLFKTLWGHDGTYQEAADMALAADFNGLEAPAPDNHNQLAQLGQVLADNRLDYIAEICTAGSYVPDRRATPDEHLASLEKKLQLSRELSPQFCNVIGGCDAWPLDTQIDFSSAHKHWPKNTICSAVLKPIEAAPFSPPGSHATCYAPYRS